MNALVAVEHVVLAVAPGAGLEAGGIGAGVRLGQAIAGEVLHGAQLRQEAPTLGVARERVDHPGRHVVDRDVGGGRGAALRQLLEDQRRVEPGERRAADVVLDVDAAEPERSRLAQRLDRKDLALVPVAGGRHHLFARERACGFLESALLVGELEVHRLVYPCPVSRLPSRDGAVQQHAGMAGSGCLIPERRHAAERMLQGAHRWLRTKESPAVPI